MTLKTMSKTRFLVPLLVILMVICFSMASNIKPSYGALAGSIPSPVSVPIHAGYLYGMPKVDGDTVGHHGVDFLAASGTNVYSSMSGTIYDAQKLSTSYGWHIIVESNHPTIAGEKVYILYAHLSSFAQNWVKGNPVTQDQLLGKSGATGNTGGNAHLHVEIRVGSNSIYDSRNPEIFYSRSTSGGFGSAYGKVTHGSGGFARLEKITGAPKDDTYKYNGALTYGYMYNSTNPFKDEAAYDMNYYIARVSSGTYQLNYSSVINKSVYFPSNGESRVSTVTLPSN